MITADLNVAELTEFTAKNKPGQRCRATFPLFGAHGTTDSASVYFELAPGESLGWHTDSAEELLLVIAGQVDVFVGREKGNFSKGQMVVVPKLVPHNLTNTGDKAAKVLGFFGGANHITSVFDEVWLPLETNMVNTAEMV